LRGYFNSKIMAYLSSTSIQDVYMKQAEVTERASMILRKDFKEIGIALESIVFEGIDTEGPWRDRLFWMMRGGVQTGYVLQMETVKEVAKEIGKSPGAGIGTGMVIVPPLLQPPPPVQVPQAQPTPPTTPMAQVAFAVCPYCGKQVPLGANFCPYCGRRVKWCSKMHISTEDAKFCSICGEELK